MNCDIIKNTKRYDFGKIIKIIGFDNLYDLVNIHDISNENLLFYFTKLNRKIARKYIDKYIHLFDVYMINNYNKIYEYGWCSNYHNVMNYLCVKWCNTFGVNNNFSIFNWAFDNNSTLDVIIKIMTCYGILEYPYIIIYYEIFITQNKKILKLYNLFGILLRPIKLFRFGYISGIPVYKYKYLINTFILVYGKY
jgi:hypothetical protein